MNKKVMRVVALCLSSIFLSACSVAEQEANSNTVKGQEQGEAASASAAIGSTASTDASADHAAESQEPTSESANSTAEHATGSMTAENEKTSPAIQEGEQTSEKKEIEEMSSATVWEQFCNIDARVTGGILFDQGGNMLVARPYGLEKVTPEGEVTTVCDLSELEKGKNYYFSSPFIWDMKYDKENNIIAAAQDRILKITEDGKVSTLIREDFSGFLGASGLELDQEGNIYVVSGGKIYRYAADLTKTEYFSTGEYQSFFSIAFRPDFKYLYLTDFYTKALIKYEINPDGTVGKGTELVREPVKNSGDYGAPLNMIFCDNGNMYVSIDGMAHLLKIDQSDKLTLIDMQEPVRNHIIAFGNEAFGEDLLYFTTYGNKVCKIKLEETITGP